MKRLQEMMISLKTGKSIHKRARTPTPHKNPTGDLSAPGAPTLHTVVRSMIPKSPLAPEKWPGEHGHGFAGHGRKRLRQIVPHQVQEISARLAAAYGNKVIQSGELPRHRPKKKDLPKLTRKERNRHIGLYRSVYRITGKKYHIEAASPFSHFRKRESFITALPNKHQYGVWAWNYIKGEHQMVDAHHDLKNLQRKYKIPSTHVIR